MADIEWLTNLVQWFSTMVVTVAYAAMEALGCLINLTECISTEQAVVFSAFFQAVAVIVSVYLAFHAVKTEKNMKSADVSIKSQERYEDLKDRENEVTDRKMAERFFERFWGAQLEQFNHWKRDMIPDSTYYTWLIYRRDQWKKNFTLPKGTPPADEAVTIQDSWRRFKDKLPAGSRFANFIDDVMALQDDKGLAREMRKRKRSLKW